ncbi:MAG: ABC transporter transmembrane domain-containing protein [Prochloraceae cyanobacterium]
MSYEPSDIEKFISRTSPWSLLPSETRADLARKMKPLRYRMGQVVAVREKFLNSLVIIYEGKVRSLGYDPIDNKPLTLELLEAGGIVGATNIVRGKSCETAIASSEVIGLNLSNQELVRLLEEYPQFKQGFLERISLIEVYDLLGAYLAEQARVSGNLKDLAQRLKQSSEIVYLSPGKHSAQELDPNKAWFISSGEVTGKISGKILEDGAEAIEVTEKTPARLLGLRTIELAEVEIDDREREMLERANNLELRGVNSLETHPEAAQQELEAIPYAEPDWQESPPEHFTSYDPDGRATSSERNFGQNYPYIRGRDPLEAGLAIFQMLSKYYGMPFRKEVINRILEDQLNRHDYLSLPFCGAVIELMGLTGQLVNVPTTAFSRLNAPALVMWEDSLAIVYEISEKNLVIAQPERGRLIKKQKPAEFFETWGEEIEGRPNGPKVGQVLLLQATKETPQERFSWRWFLPALSKYRGVLSLVLISSFFVQLFALVNPLMIQVIIDVVIVKNSPDTLTVLGFLLVTLAIFEAILGSLRTYLFVDATNRIDMSLGSQIIDHLLRLPLRYFERRPVGEISTRINELENIRQFLTGTALTAVLDAVFSVVYIVVMVIYSPLLTLVALAVVPVLFAITFVMAPIIRHQLRIKAERNAQTQSHLVEVMSGIQTVKAQNIELRSRWQWQERYARYVSAGFNTVITSTFSSSASNFLNKLSGLLVLWAGTALVLQGEITLGQLIAFRIIAGYVTSPILRLGQLWQNFQQTALSLERLADIVDTPQEAEQDRRNIPMPPIEGAVKYENVSFRFKSGGPLQLNNVNLDFPAGTFVGIVGQSGAGKSTLTKLVSRLYEPESGRVIIDGYDISKVELYSLRRQIGVVPQETLLFDGTVQENIALTTPEATSDEIIEAAKVAVAHDFIMGLPNGYNTRVGERGAGLSGGQRQRIALARSILQKPRILVLDEATSALDYATEQEVCLNLAEAFQNTTVLFITHRLGTIAHADAIVMMHQGGVVEEGTHEELMSLRGRYYSLYQQQEGIKSQL